ncbi:hypothetical protein [Nocardiopsis tropica]|uniref:Uncharacterized protein n=1 Tax=Nocardiopsis tropica TaxID=109330 RepID=A0ABU7KXJ4_9ACTN|nr:hypothetical protein [Nocardiopsis umidischolae]MEE2054025.1 hypothetical protein [Nocardiopsis umidischolae]
MRQFSAALLSCALGAAKALLLPSRGRHSARALRRRRRSTRVRRYAPLPAAPPPVGAVPARPVRPAGSTRPVRPDLPASRPLAPPRPPAPPSGAAPAGEDALVRPYYAAHERELALVQARADARLRQWTRTGPAARTPVPAGGPAPLPAPRQEPRTLDGFARAAHRVPAARREYRGVPA